MEADQIAKMVEDLKGKLDRLFLMKMQPKLHLVQRFSEIKSQVDYDAERIMLDLEKDPKASRTERQTKSLVNDARLEFVRILEILELKLLAQISANRSKELDQAVYLAIEQRAKEFREKVAGQQAGQQADMNDLEDAYVQLILDITEMANAEESKLFGNQSIFYLSSTQQTKLGSLYHLADVFLTDEQIGCFSIVDELSAERGSFFRILEERSATPDCFEKRNNFHQIHKRIERSFNRALPVSISRPFVFTKSVLATMMLINHHEWKTKNPHLVQLVLSAGENLGYSVDTRKVRPKFLNKKLYTRSPDDLKHDSFCCYIKEDDCRMLQLSGNRLRKFDSRFVPGFNLLTEIDLSNNQLESLDECLLASCKKLKLLNLKNACHPDVRFSLSFLSSLSENLEELTLTLPDGPVDFSVFSQLRRSLIIHGSSSLDSNRKPQKVTRQELSELSQLSRVNVRGLRFLSLFHFDLPSTIDQEICHSFEYLSYLSLSSCRISCIHPGVFERRCSSLKHLDFSCNQISRLTDDMFAGLSYLTALDLHLNEISEVGSKSFSRLCKLEILDLRCNRRCQVSGQDFLIKLIKLK